MSATDHELQHRRHTGGRRKEYTERIQLPLREGTCAAIAQVLRLGEDRVSFIRTAIERAIEGRR